MKCFICGSRYHSEEFCPVFSLTKIANGRKDDSEENGGLHEDTAIMVRSLTNIFDTMFTDSLLRNTKDVRCMGLFIEELLLMKLQQ